MTEVPTPRATAGRRAAIVAGGAILVVAGFMAVLGGSPEVWVDNPGRKATSFRWRLSVALADTAVLLLSATLATGPVRTLAGRRPALHLPWRRTLGVAAGITALTHLVIGLSIHGNLARPWLSFFTAWPSPSQPLPLLRGARGAANWLGLTVATVLVGLIAISNRWSLTRLGPSLWKVAQRATYLVFLLVGAHAFFYWRVERRLATHRAIVLTVMGSTALLQVIAAARLWWRKRPANAPNLVQ